MTDLATTLELPVRRRWTVRRAMFWVMIAGLTLVVLAGIPYGWIRFTASGHLYNEADLAGGQGPRADVVMVLGGQVEPDRISPRPYLRGRLDTAAQLVRDGSARVVLVSGDGNGSSGDEPAVMADYLRRHGVDPLKIVPDRYGLDTYDSCRRARDVFGLRRLLVVTQPYHLARAVALCRQLGIDADGVGARCEACLSPQLVYNAVRDYFASAKAALDVISGRDPAVVSPPSDAIARALAAS